ncbi:hypothetical protein ACS0TY_032685 [Phlomoides rotata]
MAACGGLEHIFNKSLALPLQSWKSVDHHSLTEIFGQKDNYLLHRSNSDNSVIDHHKRNDTMNSECISHELGFDDYLIKNDMNYYNNDHWKPQKTSADYNDEKYWCSSKRYSRKDFGTLPPPISCLGRNGKPWVFFKSIRKDGRFILKEIRIPTQEFLHACRKNGRLKMHFIHSDDEILDDDEDEDEDESYGDISETEDIQVTGA